MPNRMIKDSLLESDKISSLTDFEFRVWISLILLADDVGRGDARPAIIKGRAFPLRERVANRDIDGAVHGLADKGCVSLYTVGGKPYFCFPTWGDHQRIREVKPKYPAPECSDEFPQSAESCGGLRPEIELETEEENETKKKVKRASAIGDDFQRFWDVYPRKVGKEDAKKAFSKVKVPVHTLIEAVEAQKRSEQWQEKGGKFIPHPSTWLNQGRWEDELDSVKKSLEAANFEDDEDIAFMRKMMADMERKKNAED